MLWKLGQRLQEERVTQGCPFCRSQKARIPLLEAKRDGGQVRGHRGTKIPLQPDNLGKTDSVLQDEEGSLTSSFREGPSLVSTHARQQLPPWIPRKMGTLERSRPRLGRIQIFSGR